MARPTPGELLAVPPAVRHRVRAAVARLPADGRALDPVAATQLARAIELGEPWLAADPSLAELGYWMVEPDHAPELRKRGCAWLALFPSAETATRLAAIAADASAPPEVRDQAMWTLADRQLRDRHPATRWPADAVQIADDALFRLADQATTDRGLTSERLARALRHVHADAFAAVFARAPGMWGDALESFATPPLARVLYVSIEAIPPPHRIRALRLIAAALGDDAIPLLVARAGAAPPDEQLEALALAIAIGGEPQLGRFEDALRAVADPAPWRARARWQLAHRGVIPTLRGLRLARTTAILPVAERAARCAEAADDLATFARFARYPDEEAYALWAWMAHGAADPARAAAVVAAHPATQPIVGELYLAELARRGRVRALVAAAHALGAADRGALQLAIWGRPLAALELAIAAPHHTPELVCARALACYRAGRPDLTARVLAEDPPACERTDEPAAAFPGPHERWLIEHAAARRPAIGALAAGRDAVLALAQPAPHDAEPDAAALDGITAVARRLDPGLAARTVYIAGTPPRERRDAIGAAIERAGARVVAGPAPGTDYYVVDGTCDPDLIARLARDGVRPLALSTLELA